MGGVRRLHSLTEGVDLLAEAFPQQALQLARATMGACRVEYLLQGLPISEITQRLALTCSQLLQRNLKKILGSEELLPEAARHLALVPVRMGGLGLRDPTLIHAAVRLAALINVASRAAQLGRTGLTWRSRH